MRTSSVLLLDVVDGGMAGVSGRLRRLGYRTLRAKTPEEALRMVEDDRYRVEAALLPPELPALDLSGAVGALRERSGDRELGFGIVGVRPDDAGLARLEQAGVDIALWEPYPDGVLRFQVNAALAAAGARRERRQRGETRVPLARQARIHSGGPVKTGVIYTVSAAGVFVETPRPSARGSHLSLDLLLPEGDLGAAGEVVYTNVPGNLRKANLPVGMAIRFDSLEPNAERRLRRCIRDAAESLRIRPGPPPRRQRLWRLLGR